MAIFVIIDFRNREWSSRNVEVCLLIWIYLLLCFNRAIEIKENLLQYSPSKLNMAYRHYLQEHTIKEDSDCFLIGDIDEEIDFEGDLRFVFLFLFFLFFFLLDVEAYSGACPKNVVRFFEILMLLAVKYFHKKFYRTCLRGSQTFSKDVLL